MSKLYPVQRRGFRYVGVGLALVLIVAMLAGCAQVPQPPPPAAAASAGTAETSGEQVAGATLEQPANPEMTINLVIHPNVEPSGDIVEATGTQSIEFTKMFPAFLASHPNVALNAEELLGDTEGRTKYLLQCREGTQADVLQLDGFWVAEFAALGCTVPLEGIVSQELLDDYFDAFKVVYDGKVHALIPGTAFNSMLWYRTDLLEEAGLDGPPKDWNELKEYAEKLTVKDENGNVVRYGLAFSGARSELTSVTILGYYWQGEDVFVTPDNKPAFNNQTSVDMFNLFGDMYKNGSVMPEVINMGYTEVQQAFFVDKAAMMLHGSWLSSGMYNLAPDLEGKVGLAPNPVYPRTGNRGTNAGGWSFAVTTPDEAKLQNSADLLAILSGSIPEDYIEARLQGGDLPTMKSVADDPRFAETEWQKIILSELPNAKTRPAVEIYPDASLEWAQAFQETLLGQKTAEQALADAEERALAIAKEKGYVEE
jgi:multiple sugar transport system substrate-binding protein